MSILSLITNNNSINSINNLIEIIKYCKEYNSLSTTEFYQYLIQTCQNKDYNKRENGVKLLKLFFEYGNIEFIGINLKSLFECVIHLLRIGENENIINDTCNAIIILLDRSDNFEQESKKIFIQSIQKMINSIKILLQNNRPNYYYYLSVLLKCIEYYPSHFKKEYKFFTTAIVKMLDNNNNESQSLLSKLAISLLLVLYLLLQNNKTVNELFNSIILSHIIFLQSLGMVESIQITDKIKPFELPKFDDVPSIDEIIARNNTYISLLNSLLEIPKNGNITLSIDIFIEFFNSLINIYISPEQSKKRVAIKEKNLSFFDISLILPIIQSEYTKIMKLLISKSNRRLLLHLNIINNSLELMLNKSSTTKFNPLQISVMDCISEIYIMFQRQVNENFTKNITNFLLKYIPIYFNCIFI